MAMMTNKLPDYGVDDQNQRPVSVKDDKGTQAKATFGSGQAIECGVGLDARLRHDEPKGQPGLSSGTSLRSADPGV